MVIVLLLVTALVLCLIVRSHSSTRERESLTGIAILTLVFGLCEYVVFNFITGTGTGMVRGG